MPNRKSGIRARIAREAKRLRRDKKIYRFIETYAESGTEHHEVFGEDVEPLSVYLGKPGNPYNDFLAPFPLRHQESLRRMPQWEDLSAWMNVHLAVMLLHEWSFSSL